MKSILSKIMPSPKKSVGKAVKVPMPSPKGVNTKVAKTKILAGKNRTKTKVNMK